MKITKGEVNMSNESNANLGSYKSSGFKDLESEKKRLELQQSNFEELESQILKASGLKPSHNVIEIGSGTGAVSELIMKLTPNGKLTCIETDEVFSKIWHDRFFKKNLHKNNELKIGNATDILPKLDSNYDFSYVRFVLQHISFPQEIILATHHQLIDGGRIAILDSDDQIVFCYPHSDKLQKLLELVYREQKKMGGDRHVGRKLNFLLRQSGFHVLRSKSFTFSSLEVDFSTLWNLTFGFKSSLLPHLRDEISDLKSKLEESSSKGELFFSTGAIFALGEKRST